MKRHLLTTIISMAIIALAAASICGQSTGTKLNKGTFPLKDSSPKIALAYVEDSRPGVPDPFMFTHLIYAFANFNDACDGVVIKKLEKLRAMAYLKKQNPDLKVILGVGGYKREGFSEMAGNRSKRKAFVSQIRNIIDSLSLDGVDLDWEFPTTTNGGHTSSPNDDRNYVTLVKDLRSALGKDKWISYYSYNTGQYINHKRMLPYVTYVNVSGYNLSVPKEGKAAYHQSPLYPSDKLGEWSVSKVIERHIDLGIPKDKILMGIPFFGRGKSPFPSYADCNQFAKYVDNTQLKWDDEAKAPYYADAVGNLVMGFDDERSIAAKFDFIRANDMPGVFVWNYDSDYPDHRLGKAIERLRK